MSLPQRALLLGLTFHFHCMHAFEMEHRFVRPSFTSRFQKCSIWNCDSFPGDFCWGLLILQSFVKFIVINIDVKQVEHCLHQMLFTFMFHFKMLVIFILFKVIRSPQFYCCFGTAWINLCDEIPQNWCQPYSGQILGGLISVYRLL